MEKQEQRDQVRPPVPETTHAAVLLETTNRTKEIAEGLEVGMLLGVRVGYDTSPSEDRPPMQYATDCGYLELLDEVDWSKAEKLSPKEWNEKILSRHKSLGSFYVEMSDLYAEITKRMTEAAGQKIYVGLGGVLEGFSYDGYYLYCGCSQATLLMQCWIDYDTRATYCVCTLNPCY